MTGPTAVVELDDFMAQPRSAGSVIRTVTGVHLGRIGGWIAVSALVDLCVQSGNSAGSVRSALSRLKQRGLLVQQTRDGRHGYCYSEPARAMVARGTRRIFSYRQLTTDDGWMIAVFSVPDTERHLRHRLRQELIWLGCGMIAPGTWIGPGHLLDEAVDVLSQHGLRDYVTFMRTTDPRPPATLADAVAQWWNFDELNERYAEFIAAHSRTGQADELSDQQAFIEHLGLVDDWRAIPYLDPGLPPSLTPPGFLGHRGVELFLHLHERLAGPAARYVDSVVAARLDGVDG